MMRANNNTSDHNAAISLIALKNIQATKDFASELVKTLKTGDILAIRGEMGVGKTALCAAIINSFFPDVVPTSPTFNLVNIYNTQACTIHHYDLYRLTSDKEALNIGIEESFNTAITLIEWPDIIKSILPKDIITIELTSDNNYRYLSLQDNRNI